MISPATFTGAVATMVTATILLWSGDCV